MKRAYLWLIALTALSACSSGGLRETVYGRRGDVVVVNDDGGKQAKSRGPRALHVPRGHYPPAGQCRLWYEGRPPGHQPRPTSCSSLVGRVPAGAFVLYNARAYDMDHDWRREKKNGSRDVPDIIISLRSRG
jgi:hypothetical protein